MKKFPSIEQFRHVIRHVKTNHDFKGVDSEGNAIYRHDSPYPTLKFTGSVKIHGTNAAIVKYTNGDIQYQSRENVLSLTRDNAGFYLYMKSIEDKIDGLFTIPFKDHMAIYGEWCGGNIQKGVAVEGLPKMFVIFGIKVDNSWVNMDYNQPVSKDVWDFWNSINIYHICQFKTWTIDIDFNKPEEVQNKFIQITNEVEEKCPVGEYFGKVGIGEGVVWHYITDSFDLLNFKVKGEKHSVSKVTKLAAVDTELIASMTEFVNLSLQEGRLVQGIQKLEESGKKIDQSSTGDFLRWIIGDVMKEEEDTIIKNGWDPKKLNPIISKVAREWYFNQLVS
jgi:hypothetical protein